jgi:hypothetical protein
VDQSEIYVSEFRIFTVAPKFCNAVSNQGLQFSLVYSLMLLAIP